VVNHFRLTDMTIIKVDQPVCVDPEHFGHLKEKVEDTYPGKTYQPNTTPPCAPVNAK
jgi:hypothetical protein